MEIPLLKDIIIIFGLAVLVLLFCQRLKVPTIVGFLLTGVLVGPHGLGLIRAVAEVEAIAEIALRSKYGLTLLAIKRNREVLSNPTGDTRIQAGDTLILMGSRGDLATWSSHAAEERP